MEQTCDSAARPRQQSKWPSLIGTVHNTHTHTHSATKQSVSLPPPSLENALHVWYIYIYICTCVCACPVAGTCRCYDICTHTSTGKPTTRDSLNERRNDDDCDAARRRLAAAASTLAMGESEEVGRRATRGAAEHDDEARLCARRTTKRANGSAIAVRILLSLLSPFSLSLSLTSNQPHTVRATSTTNGILTRKDREDRERLRVEYENTGSMSGCEN